MGLAVEVKYFLVVCSCDVKNLELARVSITSRKLCKTAMIHELLVEGLRSPRAAHIGAAVMKCHAIGKHGQG